MDNRTNGAELNIEIEVTDNDNRGIAVLKLYGPSKKKEYVILITKSKQSDYKFITILAKNIIKPLLKQFLAGEIVGKKTPGTEPSVSVRGKKIELLKCPHCEKTSYSAPGLKGHVTKMHSSETNKRKRGEVKVIQDNNGKPNIDQVENADHIFEEATKVVNIILNDVIEVLIDVVGDEKE